ncbi:MAG: hypothetical protein JSS21_09835 [Proteobacteria bacterium]|nr:hypothetical protein [Pseudomonadota bacterium]
MNAARFIAATILATLAATAMAGQSPSQRDAKELARFQRYASPPQDSMHYFRLDGFQYLGKNDRKQDVIAVWTGVNQVYMLTLQSPCINLDLPLAISLTSTSGSVYARMDSVKYRDSSMPRQCRIETIQQVDYKAMRAEKAHGVDDVGDAAKNRQ